MNSTRNRKICAWRDDRHHMRIGASGRGRFCSEEKFMARMCIEAGTSTLLVQGSISCVSYYYYYLLILHRFNAS